VGASGSTVGAITGDVTIVAGRHYRQVGSDVIAAGAGGTGAVAPPKETLTGQANETGNTPENIRRHMRPSKGY